MKAREGYQGMKIDGWISEFIDHLHAAEKSPATIRSYESDLKEFTHWLAHQKGLQKKQLTAEQLLAYKQLLCDKQLKPNSVNRKLASLRSLLKWAEQNGRLPLHIAFPKKIREHKKGPRWLSLSEQQQLLKAVSNTGNLRDQAIITLLLHTGLRVQELCSLLWQNVILHQQMGTLIVSKGKGNKRREVALNAIACQALQMLGYKTKKGTRELIIQGQRGAMTPRGIQQLLKKYATKAKLSHLSPHQLRHTFCKNLVNVGVGLEKIAMIAGHENLESTRRYCEPSLQDLQQAVVLLTVLPLQNNTNLYQT